MALPMVRNLEEHRRDEFRVSALGDMDDIPESVIVTDKPPAPFDDPTLGVPVELKDGKDCQHRLVSLGDSLTHGFQSGAIFNTGLSYPAIIAHEMGWLKNFRFPTYSGYGGLPINIEYLLRDMEANFGEKIDWWESARAIFRLRHVMDEIEDWWERGSGSRLPLRSEINHNLAVYGWDLRDTLERTYEHCEKAIVTPKDHLVVQLVENANERAALRVLPHPQVLGNGSPLDAAKKLGEQGGIETLTVMLGANNALGTVTELRVKWSGEGYDDLDKKKAYNVWNPEHFAAEWERVVARLHEIDARNIVIATVPHVTIAPIARGVDRKVRPDSRYFPFYTRPWISDEDFDLRNDPHITEKHARAVDSAIDQYNDIIASSVQEARKAGKNWLLFDLAGLLDRLAARRYQSNPAARPVWWRPYELPHELESLQPKIDSRFFSSDTSGRQQGGLFSLDGVHPTTIAYGIVAQEIINLMQAHTRVVFHAGDGVTPRFAPVRVDFKRLLRSDTLISDPPKSLQNDIKLIGWVDEQLDVFSRLLRLGL